MKKRLLYICPHLSTGGQPQYVYKQITHFKEDFEIRVVEINNSGGDAFVVQKNKIRNEVPLYTLDSDKGKIVDIIEYFNPDIIHFHEIPQFDLSFDILDKIFKKDRNYDIVVTTHGSMTNPDEIVYHPDRYVLVSEWSRRKFEHLGIDTTVWEYPIEDYTFDREEARKILGFEDGWKHVLNVGLFAPGKNQKEIFQIAEELKEHKIKFHFVGNQAGNFESYWKPLMENKPDNCVVWGERNDVDTFYKASDAFYFSSILELNPLSIKEALSYRLPSLFRRLDTYLDTYDTNPLVHYIDNDLEKTKKTLLSILNDEIKYSNKNVVSVVLSYADTDYRKKLLKECLENIHTQTILSSHYPVDTETQLLTDWTIYERDNPLLFKEDYHKYNVRYYFWKLIDGEKVFKDFDYEHSYAVYKLIQIALKFAKKIGKEYIHIINYDYTPTEEILDSHIKYLNEGNDFVFYAYNDTSYSSGFFSGRIDSLLVYFEKYNTIDEFYTVGDGGLVIFEDRIHRFFNNGKFKIKELEWKSLEDNMKVNQEGFLNFSKDWNGE
jgi:hypothetical protein